MARILLITPYLSWPKDHGGRIRSHALFAPLAAEHELINVSGCQPEDEVEAAQKALSALGFRVKAYPVHPRFGRLSLAERLRKARRLLCGQSSLLPRFESEALHKAVRQEGVTADLVILDHLWLARTTQGLKAPLVFSTHNVESDLLMRRAATLSGLQRHLALREALALRRAERALLAGAAATIAVSAADRECFHSIRPDALPALVIPNGVDLKSHPFRERESAGPTRLLYLGGYDYAPNADAARRLALEVLPRVQGFAPEAEAVLVGRDPGGVLADLAGQRGLILRGRVEDLEPEWRGATALVLPLRFGGGSRIKILEAFALGCPVISTRAGLDGLPEEALAGAFIAETPEAMAEALQQVLRNPSLRDEKAKAARAFVAREADWETLAGKVRDLVREVLALKSGGRLGMMGDHGTHPRSPL